MSTIIVSRKGNRNTTTAFYLTGKMSRSVPFADQGMGGYGKKPKVTIPPTSSAYKALREWCKNHNVRLILSQEVSDYFDDLYHKDITYLVPKLHYFRLDDLYSHQVEAVESILAYSAQTKNKNISCLIADDPRLGKSISALSALSEMMIVDINSKHKFVLILCPKPLIWQWENYVKEWFEVPSNDLNVVVLSGSGSQRADLVQQYTKNPSECGCTVFITNYHSLLMPVGLKRLKYWGMIADEAHVLKNRKAQISQAVKKIKSKHQLLLSATFTESTSAELWQPLNIVAPHRFTSYWNFAGLYANVEEGEYGYTIQGSRNKEMLEEVLWPFYLRRTDEVLGDAINQKIEETWYCKADDDFKEANERYEEVKKQTIVELSEGTMFISTELSRLTRLRQVTIHPNLIDQGIKANTISLDDLRMSPKLSLLEQIISSHIPQDEQVIVYSSFIAGAHYSAQIAQKHGKAQVYAGSIGDDETIQAFKNGEFRTLCATPQRGGVGLTLDNADWIIYLDLPWSSILLRQAQDRTRKIGKTKPTTIIKIVLKNTIDEVINNILLDKLETIGEEEIADAVIKHLHLRRESE